MKKVLLVSFLLCLLNFPVFAAEKNLGYRSTTDKKEISFTESIVTGDEITITAGISDAFFKVVCQPDYSTRLWEYSVTNQNILIKAERNGNWIKLDGQFKGKEISKTLKIDERPWLQSWDVSFGSFALSDQESMLFWTIRADNLKEYMMMVSKEQEEIIKVNGRDIDSIKVKVALTGWLVKFWHAYYWFRKSDGIFIKYEGANGPVGTPKTVTELISEN